MSQNLEIKRKVLRMRTGDQFVYHVGDLQYDRHYHRDPKTAYIIHMIAKTIYNAYEDGKVALIQRRVPDKRFGTFEYVAVRL
jgi:hypothetical protein